MQQTETPFAYWLISECDGIIITWVAWLRFAQIVFLDPSKCTEIVQSLAAGASPDPTGGAYSAPPDPLAGLRGPTSKGPSSKERGGRGKERGGDFTA